MGENINKEFEKYQQDLEVRDKKLKMIVKFEPDEEMERLLEELKHKKITL